MLMLGVAGQAWLLLPLASGYLLNWKHILRLEQKRGDLSPNGSCFVIQHVSHLVNNRFLSVPDTRWENRILLFGEDSLAQLSRVL